MKIAVIPARDEWTTQFTAERDALARLLGEPVIAIEHIGSTAVPGLAAKPVIDIQVGIDSLESFDASDAAGRLCEHGYVHRTDLQPLVPFRRFFKREASECGPNTNLHIVEPTHPWWDRHILFRDYLRASASARDQYQDLKMKLAEQEWADVNAYGAAKDALVWQLEEEAFDHFGLDEKERARILRSRVI